MCDVSKPAALEGISAHPKVEFDLKKFSSIKMASTPRHVSGRHSSASHSHQHHSSFKPEMHPSGVVSGPNSRANSRQHRHHHHHHHHHRRNREHQAESSGHHGGISFVVEKPRKYIMESEMEIADEELILGDRPISKLSKRSHHHHHQVNLLKIIITVFEND